MDACGAIQDLGKRDTFPFEERVFFQRAVSALKADNLMSRLLSTLMALQAGLPLLNYSVIKGKQREAYFAAVQTGMGRNYKPMQEIFRRVVQASN